MVSFVSYLEADQVLINECAEDDEGVIDEHRCFRSRWSDSVYEVQPYGHFLLFSPVCFHDMLLCDRSVTRSTRLSV